MGGIIGSILVQILPNPDQHCPIFTNASIVDDDIRFVSHKSKEKVKSTDSDDKEESKEPDYYGGEDQLEKEEEEQGGEMTMATTNEIF